MKRITVIGQPDPELTRLQVANTGDYCWTIQSKEEEKLKYSLDSKMTEGQFNLTAKEIKKAFRTQI